MDARRFNPLRGLAIALSIAFSAQAQYFPAPEAVSPQMMHPQFMMAAGHNMVPHGPQSMPVMQAPRSGHSMPMLSAPMMSGTPLYGGPMSNPSLAGAPLAAVPASASQAMMQPWLPPDNAPAPTKRAKESRLGQRGQPAAESANFIVFANDKAWAEQVAETAERQRRELAEHWLGKELPQWSGRCPIHVNDAPNLGAGGETRFIVQQGTASNWMMSVQGTRERILDSVLPHEISHTIFATYFGRLNKYVPRWADEGAATTVEHEAEKSKHRHYLRKFLQTGRGLAFNTMFQLKEYPKDILPLYAQGHSAVQFLIDQESPRHFVKFLETGMQTENWQAALAKFYAYESIGDFQTQWNKWLFDGSPQEIAAYSPWMKSRALASSSTVSLAAATLPNKSLNNDTESVTTPEKSAAVLADSRSPAVNAGRLPSDPRSLELIPSHAQDSAAFQSSSAPRSIPFNSELAMNAVEPQTASAGPAGTEQSFFQTKLRQTSGQPATPIPAHNSFAGNSGSN
jgi:hypothetical protein